MCLNADKLNPLKGRYPVEFDENGYVTCYKVYQIHTDPLNHEIRQLTSPCFPGPRKGRRFITNGWIVSNRRSKEISLANGDHVHSPDSFGINRGIHIYLTAEQAKSEWIVGTTLSPVGDFRIVPVRCHRSQLVGVSYYAKEAVFMKVFLKKEDYKKASKNE